MLVNCAHCHKEYNPSFSRCPFCGAEKPDEKPALNAAPRCPHCEIDLKVARLRDNEVDICPECHGIWLDSDEFDFLVSRRDVSSDPAVPRKYRRKPLPTGNQARMYIPCPRCNDLMNRKNFKRISGVIIDVCKKHGVWLDAGELDQIRSFVANVDYDEYLLKEIEFNQNDIRSLNRQLGDVKLVQLATEFWNLKYWLYK
jgi:Zn-finger nucleic acid-binding protein